MEAILAAAAQVFELHGYAAGTTNRIAEAAGVSIGTLYQYFHSKEALAVALLERHIDETQRQLKEWVGHMLSENHTLPEALADYIDYILDIHLKQPRLQHILLEETVIPEPIHRVLLESEQRSARVMGGLLRTYGEVRHPKLNQAGYLIIHTVEALIHRFAAHPEESAITREDLKGELLRMLKAYLV